MPVNPTLPTSPRIDSTSRSDSTFPPLLPEERAVIAALRDLPFGQVEVVVHQSRIVQIVKTEKVRV
jgi:hypothetical protein